LFRKRSNLHGEEHLQNFTVKTLQETVKKAGLLPMKIDHAEPVNPGFPSLVRKILSFVGKMLFKFRIHLGGIHLIAQNPK